MIDDLGVSPFQETPEFLALVKGHVNFDFQYIAFMEVSLEPGGLRVGKKISHFAPGHWFNERGFPESNIGTLLPNDHTCV